MYIEIVKARVRAAIKVLLQPVKASFLIPEFICTSEAWWR